ncbi:hypothetical protein CC1G_14896 [Coprinopsis cinerea okayama7|uniref:Uncharacterized protein n=1 Tax=Coprinopsis cinerea (strain Okayama-7 / 130 / ATCC MYA-4618 / FGSC 9003) TaxID=240176 RepID=D6RNK9_COPC7|nr:hypothetical protein CC1G_14896 [Coprinopsis cinerea okayama7\|eukprot:XP_002910919.1 hypothetical protein CC1G_14896 [Coprinopsis cinerea okayama7\
MVKTGIVRLPIAGLLTAGTLVSIADYAFIRRILLESGGMFLRAVLQMKSRLRNDEKPAACFFRPLATPAASVYGYTRVAAVNAEDNDDDTPETVKMLLTLC